jgi:sigma54-dependent transcription regulator
MMTRKDFELIAGAMRDCRVSVANGYPVATSEEERYRDTQRIAVHRAACHELARVLANGNPRFDRSWFLAACGLAP